MVAATLAVAASGAQAQEPGPWQTGEIGAAAAAWPVWPGVAFDAGGAAVALWTDGPSVTRLAGAALSPNAGAFGVGRSLADVRFHTAPEVGTFAAYGRSRFAVTGTVGDGRAAVATGTVGGTLGRPTRIGSTGGTRGRCASPATRGEIWRSSRTRRRSGAASGTCST